MHIGKIAPIKKEYSNAIETLDQQLAKHGFSRSPGTGEVLTPYLETSGRYRTGLDVHAKYLLRMSEEDRKAEIEKITEAKSRLEDILGVPGILESNSLFYNFSASKERIIAKFGTDLQVTPIRLTDKEEYFDDADVLREIQWYWLKSHPRVAPSMSAYLRGDVSSDVKYYVVDDKAEALETYRRKKEVNKATADFEDLVPTKKKQIARLMGLPVTESTSEETVYNLLDTELKKKEFEDGEYKGGSPIRLFNELIKMTDKRLEVKDLVKQAIAYNVYRKGQGGKITEGGLTISPSQEELVEFLLDDKNAMDLLALEQKLTNKKISS